MDELKDYSRVFEELAYWLSHPEIYHVAKYISPKLVIKATRKRFKKKIDKRRRREEIVYTVGPPNYEEREKIRFYVSMGEKFPLQYMGAKYVKNK